MKRLSSLLAAGALTAAALVSPVAGAATLKPQEVAVMPHCPPCRTWNLIPR